VIVTTFISFIWRNTIVNRSLPSDQTPLALARKQRGWTQAYVAEQVGVSTGAVRRWESGRLPYPTSIQKLCQLFALNPRELGLFKDPLDPPASEQWRPEDAEKQAAWEIYIELITRVPLAVLAEEQGILREALSSLYALFQITRTILRHLGPVRSRPAFPPEQSPAFLAVTMLNSTLRPLLVKWHPLLTDYEGRRPVSMGMLEYEHQWERYAELRREIAGTRPALLDYANAFAHIAGSALLLADPAGQGLA
jgi:transcriptional regulator with XRE-family HTH domain